MITNRLNINLVLCQEYDKKTKTIKKIFNEITTNNKHEATFSVITFVNGFYGNNEEDRFILHYFLVQAKENTKQNVERPRMGLYLGATEFYRRPEKKSENNFNNCDNTFSELAFEDIPFIGEGEYIIEAYKVDGILDENEPYEELREKAIDVRKDAECVSTILFKVNYPNK